MKLLISFLPRLFILLSLFTGAGAVPSGYGLITANGLGMPVEWLNTSLFDSYLTPGLILIFVIGGTQLCAAYFFIKHHLYELEIGAITGFGLIIWIFTQQYIIQQAHWLQIVYFSIGVTELVIIMLLMRVSKRKAV